MKIEYTYDQKKSEDNVKKHKVTFETAKEVFSDPLNFTTNDDSSSATERRYQTVGMTRNGKLLVVIHADDYRQDYQDEVEYMRIISARVATPSERRRHERWTRF